MFVRLKTFYRNSISFKSISSFRVLDLIYANKNVTLFRVINVLSQPSLPQPKTFDKSKFHFFLFYFGTKITYKNQQIFCNKIAQNMEFNVTRVTYQTMHLHPKIYFQPCPSNTSVLIVSPEFAYEKDRHVAIFSLSSSGERPRRWHWKFGTKTIRVNAPLVRTPARLESNLNEPPTTKKCKSSRQ